MRIPKEVFIMKPLRACILTVALWVVSLSGEGTGGAMANDGTGRGLPIYFVAPEGDDASAGTAAAPLRSIGEAARRAVAGDRVIIRPGLYEERVEVANQGSPARPITFEAETPGTAIVGGSSGGFQPMTWVGDHDAEAGSGNHWVTLRGLVFRGTGKTPAVRAATGWRIENVRFEDLGFGINIRGNDVVVSHSIFEDIDSADAHAIVAAGGRNLRFSDIVIRRVNGQRLIQAVDNSAVTKFLDIDGLLIERIVSEDNHGPGLWLDTNNRNFVIRNSLIRNNSGPTEGWQGPGIWIELNAASNGQIYGNTIIGNSSAGIEVMESSGLAIHDNILLDNPACIAFRNLPRGKNGGTILADIHVYDNLCAGWKTAAIATGIGNWEGFDPATHGIVVDRGRYLATAGPLFSWNGIEVTTTEDATLRLGFEQNGRID
jgi:hypothetical protein